jgi:hypothetical protein
VSLCLSVPPACLYVCAQEEPEAAGAPSSAGTPTEAPDADADADAECERSDDVRYFLWDLSSPSGARFRTAAAWRLFEFVGVCAPAPVAAGLAPAPLAPEVKEVKAAVEVKR